MIIVLLGVFFYEYKFSAISTIYTRGKEVEHSAGGLVKSSFFGESSALAR